MPRLKRKIKEIKIARAYFTFYINYIHMKQNNKQHKLIPCSKVNHFYDYRCLCIILTYNNTQINKIQFDVETLIVSDATELHCS